MDPDQLRDLLAGVASGAVHPIDAQTQLSQLPFADLGFAKIDHHRELRQGLPEAVYAPSKTADQCRQIVQELLSKGSTVLLSRASEEQIQACPNGATVSATGSGLYSAVWNPKPALASNVVVLTAGTADQHVGGEIVATLNAYGIEPRVITDCGVAGIHRLLGHVEEIASAQVVVVVAGMEGALASVVGGLTKAPIIAVPTSTGYGSSFEGVTALLAMMSSCAPGVTVVGIDNGYGAAVAVYKIVRLVATPL